MQLYLDADRLEQREPTGKTIGLDVCLSHFYTDSNGDKVENTRYLRKSETALKRAQKRLSRKEKWSKNRARASIRLGKQHLKNQRQRQDFAVKLARCVLMSNDVVVFEDLQLRKMANNHHLAKSITDASWSIFRQWIEYFGLVFGVITVAVSPHNTSQKCSKCGAIVKKTLSTRTHQCACNTVLCRDENAARNILQLGLSTVGHTGIHAWEDDNPYSLSARLDEQVVSQNQETLTVKLESLTL